MKTFKKRLFDFGGNALTAKRMTILLLSFLPLLACKTPEARRPVSQESDTFIKESIKINKELVAYEESLIKDIIEEDTMNNYITSSHGFWYYYEKKNPVSNGKKPEFGDKVVFNYDISRLDGTPIYTKEEIGERVYVMDQENLFTGLRQGLKLMEEGETVTFLFPSYTAFGYYGDNAKIGTNVPIKSTVSLKSIQIQDTLNQSK
jgi:gliding motility-associated peptidyl-prolyl isomerase